MQTAYVTKAEDGSMRIGSGNYVCPQAITVDDLVSMFEAEGKVHAFRVRVDKEGHLRVGKWRAAAPLTVVDVNNLHENRGGGNDA
jgi:hypothetical protein